METLLILPDVQLPLHCKTKCESSGKDAHGWVVMAGLLLIVGSDCMTPLTENKVMNLQMY